MKAARYTRVSTARQADNTSIPNQLDRTETYIEAQGWELVGTFVEPGESGENLDRPALTAARQAIRRGEVDVLVVYTLDRLTRNIDDLFLLRREFTARDVKTWAVHDALDITTADPDDLLAVLFKGYFSHRERETIKRRMREGVERILADGKWTGGRTPYGYRRDPDSGKLVIHKDEAHIVKLIFGWLCCDGLSSYAIAKRLTALEILSPQAARQQKGKRCNDGTQDVPKRWTSASVRFLLHNETYVGRWTFGKKGKGQQVTIDCPAIIDQVTFDKAQALLMRNRRNTGGPRYRYLLRGLIRCECKAAYCGHTDRRGDKIYPSRYKCLARLDYRKQRRDRPCKGAHVMAAELEGAVWADIEEFVRQPHIVAQELTKRREPAEDITARLAEVDRAISERKAELDRYLALYGRGVIPVEQLDVKASEARGHISALETYRATMVEEQRRADLWEREMVNVIEALSALQVKLDGGVTWEDKRALVEMLVKGVVIETRIDESGKRYPVAHITYKFERPTLEAPVPAELVPLFGELESVGALTSMLDSAIIRAIAKG